jgi:Na+-translocating ferredoxin:NAD+ oxidoreductase RNF subunit RnfB
MNARTRSFPALCTRCNMCIASGPNVYVRFCREGGEGEEMQPEWGSTRTGHDQADAGGDQADGERDGPNP